MNSILCAKPSFFALAFATSILLVFSIASWATMFIVGRRFGRSGAASKRFIASFRRAKRLADVQAATGQGGTCYGDGGDPNFIGGTNVEGAVQDGHAGFGASNSPCHSIGFGFRLDTRQARSFLANYVTLP